MDNSIKVQRPRLSSRDLRDSLVSTLRQLCAQEVSVTHVCRETGINRQQFAKYLDGRSMPSFENAMRIADYFDIACEELFGFRSVHDASGYRFVPPVDESSVAFKAKQAIETIEKTSEYFDIPTVGFYFFYINVAAENPKLKHSFIKSLMRIERVGGEIVTERRQYLQSDLGFSRTKMKYYGTGQTIDGMLSLRYCDPVKNDHLSFLLVRPHHFRGNNLAGILVGRCNTYGGEAGASAVYLDFIGEKPNLRKAVSECGLFPHGKNLASAEIETVLKTKMRDDQFGLVVR